MKNKKKIILLSIFVLIMLVLVTVVSQAFFNMLIRGNESAKKVRFKGNPLGVVFSDGTSNLSSSTASK